MKVLIVGGGGREHALAWKVAQSPKVQQVYVAPGNAGTKSEPKTSNLDITADDLSGLLAFAKLEAVDLTIIGPEAPLVAGIVDHFEAAGLRCFGPHQSAAALEGSKTYAKAFLQRHGIATAPYATFSRIDQARAHIEQQVPPIVVKADGLAAGKGVVIAQTVQEALAAAEAMLQERQLGAAGQQIVVEGFLEGEEASFMVITDGEQALPLASSQDHKARDDGDRGPNTGGMGAYSPAPVVTAAMQDRIMREIILPTIRGMAADGRPYRGFLYAGIMIDREGNPQVLEFNCRLGDPETQVILMRLQSDLVTACLNTLEGDLCSAELQWDPRTALGVVMTAEGYPGTYRQGDPISGLPESNDSELSVFHAGTQCKDGQVVTAGGRVLSVCALGEDVSTAQRLAYDQVQLIRWAGAYARSDIGYRAVARERA